LGLLACAHDLSNVALEVEHLLRRKGTAGSARRPSNANELSSLHALLELGLDVPNGQLTHRSDQRITQDGAFVNDGLALQIPLLPKRHCHARGDAMRRIFVQLESLVRLPDEVRGLIAEGRRHLSMRALHFLMRAVDLCFPCLVRGDLGGAGAMSLELLQVHLDLLTPRTRRL
jgi:hypothetical protein